MAGLGGGVKSVLTRYSSSEPVTPHYRDILFESDRSTGAVHVFEHGWPRYLYLLLRTQ